MCHLIVIQKSDGSGIIQEFLNNYYLNFDQKSNLLYPIKEYFKKIDENQKFEEMELSPDLI